MTPTAATPAARTKQGARPTPAARPPQGRTAAPRPASPHPATPRPAHRPARASVLAPRTPRRVSGPAAGGAPPPPVREPRRAPALTPAPKRRASPRAPGVPAGRPPLGIRALAFARTLPDHALLDRLLRGRLWIPLLGVLLIGIVASQVEILKLNASLGSGVVRAAQLQSENERLANAVSQLSDVQRIEQRAAHMGLSMPPAYTPVFLPGGPGELGRALRNIHRPDPAAFQARAAALAAHRAAAVQSTTGA